MKKSSSNVIFARLPDKEYQYVYKQVAKSKMTLKSWLEFKIREMRLRDEEKST